MGLLTGSGTDPRWLGSGRNRPRNVLPGQTDTGVAIWCTYCPRLVAYSRQRCLRQPSVGRAGLQVRPDRLRVAEASAAEVAGRGLHGLLLLPGAGARCPWKASELAQGFGSVSKRAGGVSERPGGPSAAVSWASRWARAPEM